MAGTRETLHDELRDFGARPDDDLPLAEAALTLAAFAAPDTDLTPYKAHLDELIAATRARHAEILRNTADSAALRLAALRAVLADAEDYRGDSQTYDDLQNASLVRVIDRRRGLPVALAILYIHVARGAGWTAQGLNFPGHFLVRLDVGGERLIFDPFDGAKAVEAHDLRKILKETQGPGAELSADYYAPVDNRGILLRLQNNIKSRQIAAEDYQGASDTVALMRLFAPGEPRLWLEAGVLAQRAGRLREAETALTAYQPLAADETIRRDVALMLQQIRRQLSLEDK